jgi:peptide deformylase
MGVKDAFLYAYINGGQMAVLRILKYGDKLLRKKTKQVSYQEIKNRLPLILKDMYDTMEFANGIGLSANQVGLDMQLAIISYKENTKHYNFVIINPVIVSLGGEIYGDEGCLSFPGFFIKVKRYENVVVRAINENGLPVEIKATGLLARAFQHEIDHLNGVLFIDYLPLRLKLRYMPVLAKLKRQWKKIDESKMEPRVI